MLAPACAILEAILFASGDPISFSRLAAASGIPERELPQLLNDLNTAYQKSGHALQVLLLEKTAQLCTVERYAPYIQAALEQKRTLPLTPAALEVLTIAAYHQPVTKRFIAHVRGIDSSSSSTRWWNGGCSRRANGWTCPASPLPTAPHQHSCGVSGCPRWTTCRRCRKFPFPNRPTEPCTERSMPNDWMADCRRDSAPACRIAVYTCRAAPDVTGQRSAGDSTFFSGDSPLSL